MISKRARYALHGIGFLAHKRARTPVSFGEILEYLQEYSRDLSFSSGYIAKIFQDLSRAGIVHAVVGRKGGYALARPAREVRVIDVVAAMDGHPVEDCCLLSIGGCDNQSHCGVYQVIQKAQSQFYKFLAVETAESLAVKMFGRPRVTAARRTATRGRAAARKRTPARKRR